MTGHLLGAVAALVFAAGAAQAEPVGQFINHKDIGAPKFPGAVHYDVATKSYSVTGGGTNMWADKDDFHYAWKRMTGDVAGTTELVFTSPSPAPGAPGYVHRKGGIILRQDLDTDSAYVDALRMGNQQLSLQYRETKGGQTHLIWINTPNQGTVRLEKIGDYAFLSVPGPDGKLHHAGGSFKLKITGPYYIGIGVCPHDNAVTETMKFSNVTLKPLARKPGAIKESTLQTMQVINPWEQTAVVTVAGALAAPRWSADGKSFSYGSGSQFYRVPADGMETGAPVKIAAAGSSNDGSVSPDGKWVYFSAGKKLWRGHPDGSGRQQVTSGSDTSDWSPHVSPDGKWLLYASARAYAVLATGADVEILLMPLTDGAPDAAKAQTMAKLYGGAGVLDFQPWSPDSKNFAFVSNRP